MDQLVNFWENVKKEEEALLATSAHDYVTMRTISPVYYDGAILIFTSPNSQKYLQLKENPRCVLAVGGGFMEAKAEFPGPTMLNENTVMRETYEKKFNGAFEEGLEFGGRDAEFVLLKPTRIKGWIIEDGMPVGPFEYNF